MTTRKTIALTRQTFVGKVMSLLFNMLSRLIIAFLPRSKCLLISWLQSPYAVILEPKKIKLKLVRGLIFVFKLKYSWFTMLCQPQLYRGLFLIVYTRTELVASLLNLIFEVYCF